MKNFYEATVTRPNLRLEVILRVKPVGTVLARMQINDASWATEVAGEKVFKHEIGITEPIDIQIQIQRNHPEALEIELEIDGHKLLPLYQHLASPATCYIDSNKLWKFHIPNFYPWLHEITGQGWII